MTAFVSALPAIAQLLLELWKWIKDGGLTDPAASVMQIAEAVKLQRTAKNAEDRRAAARALSRAINRL